MKPGQLLSRLFWRGAPVLFLVWALRSGVIDYRKYAAILQGETRSPAEVQLEKVADVLVRGYVRDHTLPDGYRLGFWLNQNPEAREIGPRPDLDPFGNSLRLVRMHDGFVLSSDGPDRRPNTADDLTYRVEGLEKKRLLE